MIKTALIKALKELGRIVVIAILPVFVSSVNLQTGLIDINWAIVLATAFVATLKVTDKFLHELGNEYDDENLKRGLVRF